MLKQVLTGKIHCARLTMCDLNYEGSMAIDIAYLRAADILPYEKILVVNRSNGERLETYAIPAAEGSRMFCLNGPAALKGAVGDVVTVMAFSVCEAGGGGGHPSIIVLDEDNSVIQRKGRIADRDMLGGGGKI